MDRWELSRKGVHWRRTSIHPIEATCKIGLPTATGFPNSSLDIMNFKPSFSIGFDVYPLCPTFFGVFQILNLIILTFCYSTFIDTESNQLLSVFMNTFFSFLVTTNCHILTRMIRSIYLLLVRYKIILKPDRSGATMDENVKSGHHSNTFGHYSLGKNYVIFTFIRIYIN